MGRFGAALGAMAMCAAATATTPDHILPGVKLDTPPTIDGVVDTQVEWAQAPSGTGFFDGMTGQAAPVGARFWLAYDEKYIYFAAKMQDPNPKGIVAVAYQTNVALQGDDFIRLRVDPVGNLTDWSTFAMNAKGATDIRISGGRAAKREWNGEFIAKGRITGDGWEVEARIPWTIMDLPAAGPRTLRIDVDRYYSHLERFYDWSLKPGDSVEEYGKWSDVTLPKTDSRRTLKLLPYGYVGAANGGSDFVDAGLDMKSSIAKGLEFVGAIRPDFRNIEENILSLDYSHFARIAAESRPFFLEGGNDLDPMYTGQFVSRRIPNFDLGLKLYGKLSEKTTIGLLEADTFDGPNAVAFTVQQAPDRLTQIALTGTSLDGSGDRNHTAGLALGRQMGAFSFMGNVLATDDAMSGGGFSANGMLAYTRGAWFGYGNYQEADARFDPALGLAPIVDFKGPGASVGYSGLVPHGSLSEVTAGVFAWSYDHLDGAPFYNLMTVYSSAKWRNRFYVQCSATFDRYEEIDEHTVNLTLGKGQNDPNRSWSVGTTWGSQAGSAYFTPTLNVAYRPLRKLLTTLTYQYVDLVGTSDQAILKANYDLGRESSVSALLVKQNEDWNAYFAYCRTGNLGAEYYFIIGDPNALSFHPSLIFKVAFPIDIKL